MATFAPEAPAYPTSPTQFACAVAGITPTDPPADRKGVVHRGGDADCWLCGGPTDGIGWRQGDAIAPTFTQNNLAKTQDSETVCRACATLTKAASFQAAVASHGLDIKMWVQAGWHSYSHLFIAPGTYECPRPSRVREILLDPPAQPFLLTINASGQKHTVFRGRVCVDRDLIPVHFDDETFDVDRARFADVLGALEALSEAGFSKDSTLSGRYHPEAVRRCGLARWRALEEAVRPFREREYRLLSLAHYCGRSPTFFKDLKDKEAA